jgi:hypothetical protein
MDQRYSSNSNVPALQAQSSEFKSQFHKKKIQTNKKPKENEREIQRERQKETKKKIRQEQKLSQ